MTKLYMCFLTLSIFKNFPVPDMTRLIIQFLAPGRPGLLMHDWVRIVIILIYALDQQRQLYAINRFGEIISIHI